MENNVESNILNAVSLLLLWQRQSLLQSMISPTRACLWPCLCLCIYSWTRLLGHQPSQNLQGLIVLAVATRPTRCVLLLLSLFAP
jgi:hypothetical protein